MTSYSYFQMKDSPKKSILLVDDDLDFCNSFQRILLRDEYDVTTASDGINALELLSKKKFDLLITDVRMPNMDGIELVKEIRRRSLALKIIIISAYGNSLPSSQASEMKIFKYINKPVRREEILNVIENAFKTN